MHDDQLFAEIWKKARYDAGVSQDELAERMNVSKRTIQNWEAGFTSPSQSEGFRIFRCLGLQPLPYYMNILFPDSSTNSESDLDDRLIKFVRSLSASQKKKLLFFFTSPHGSSAAAALDMLVANLHTPLIMREGIARSIIGNYEMAMALGMDTRPNDIHPDIDMVKRALENAIESTLKGSSGYSMTEVDDHASKEET